MLAPQLTLLVIRCRDIDRSLRFYSALGLSFVVEQHGAGPVHHATQLGSLVLELYPSAAPTTSLRLGLIVEDVAAAVAALQQLGATLVRYDLARPSALIRDPDDNTIELTTSDPAPPHS